MIANELIERVLEKGGALSVEDGQLVLTGNKGAFDEQLVQQIKQHKQGIINLLQAQAENDSRAAASLPPIEQLPPGQPSPLSFAQQRLWFIDRFSGSAQYNIPVHCRLHGLMQPAALEQALATIIERHQVLRSRFIEVDGVTCQQVIEPFDFRMPPQDLSPLPPTAQMEEVARLAAADSTRPFDLQRGELLLRATLLRLADDDHVLLLNLHHIAADGWSMGQLFKELGVLYQAYAEQRPNPLPPLAVQYADYAKWQRQWLQGEVLEAELDYWRQQLWDMPQLHQLPLDYERPRQPGFAGRVHRQLLDAELGAAITRACNAQRVTPFIFLQTIFAVLIGRFAAADDVVVGTPIAGRTHGDTEDLIGFFVNTLVLRCRLQGNPEFSQLLNNHKKIILDAFDHQQLPFDMLVDELQVERDLSHSPIFQLTFTLENDQEQTLQLGDLTLKPLAADETVVKFDLELSIRRGDDGLRVAWNYNPDLFAAATIEQLASSYTLLLKQVVAHPECPIDQLALTDDEQRQRLLRDHSRCDAWVEPVQRLPADDLSQRFSHQAMLHGDQAALSTASDSLSYHELEQRSNQLAHYLREQGAANESLVALVLPTGVDLLLAQLAVIKAGAAYVPLSGLSPEALEQALAMLDISLVVTARDRAEPLRQPLLLVDAPATMDSIAAMPTTLPPTPRPLDQQLACMLYAPQSAAAGGVLPITHAALLHMLDHADYPRIAAGEQVVSSATHSHDCDSFIIWQCWLNGGHYRCVDSSGERWLQQLQDADHLVLDGAAWNTLPAMNAALAPQLQYLITTADVAIKRLNDAAAGDSPASLLRLTTAPSGASRHIRWQQVRRPHARGVYPIRLLSAVAREQSHSAIYLLDRQLQPVPPGAVGQVYRGGRYLAAAVTVDSPFIDGEKLCPSGDWARWTVAGENLQLRAVDYLPDAVLIRGRRVSPAAVSQRLREQPEIADGWVDCFTDNQGQRQLVAYVALTVAAADQMPALHNVHVALRSQSAAYAMPARYVPMAALPREADDRIDVTQLPDPQRDGIELNTYAAPRNQHEQALCTIWQDLLNLDRIGIDDNFFLLGGHSLIATRLVSRLRHALNVELPLRVLFERPTVRALAEVIGEYRREEQLPPIVRVDRDQPLPLSFAQQRLWFLDQLDGGSPQYNMPMVYRLDGQLHLAAFEQAINGIIQRHEVLRTNFIDHADHSEQVIRAAEHPPLRCHDLRGLSDAQQQQRIGQLLRDDAAAVFDLKCDLLLRVQLIRLADDCHLVMSNMHHIASDGWSMGLFFKELSVLYNAACRSQVANLPELPIQYADFAHWQRQWLQGEVLAAELAYWRQQLTAAPPLHQLPLDHPRPALQKFAGQLHRQTLHGELLKPLRQLCQQYDVTLFMLLQTAFAVLVGRHGNQDDVIMGTPIAGRTHSATEALIGFFVNTLVLRTRLVPDASFAALLTASRQQILDAYTHQHIPFEMLVEELQPERNLQYSPLFQIVFALQNTSDATPALDGLRLSSVESPHQIIKFDLELLIGEREDQLQLNWNYNTALFEAATIERLAASYAELLQGIVADVHQPIAKLPLLPAAQREQLTQWNNTTSPLPAGSVAAQFEQQVELRPEQTGVIIDGEPLSYIELNRQANQLAAVLRGQGVSLESRVGVCLGRGPWLLPSLLAIWKAGGAYVPLDPAYPSERLNFMIADAGIELVLTVGAGPDDLNARTLDLNSVDLSADNHADSNPSIPVAGASLAYVIYTSGSTGRPKGVMVSHRNILRLLIGTDFMTLDDQVRMLQAAPVAFDASTLELWAPLIHGGVCVLYPGDTPTAAQLASVIREQQISHAWLTAALFNTLVDESAVSLRGLKQLAVGGEAVSAAHVKRLYQLDDQVQLINGYGPTESTTFACCHPIPRDLDEHASVAIGGPIGNTQAYVLDSQLQALPIGVVGELYLGGEGLARGYLDRPGLTAERFVPSPFATGERLYRTGDLCRWRADGAVDYVGRVDDQIKLRGFRIELGEVESRLQEQCGVQAAVAQVVDGELGQQLVGYVVVDGDFDENALKAGLQSSLPGYMVPLAIIELNSLPLTANGKLDRSRLPAPDWSDYHREYVAPRDATEEQLAAMFTALLPVEQVGIDDNFFELGGHSLLATRLISRVRQGLELELPLRLLFERPTVRGLAAALSHHADSLVLPPITPADRTQPLALSYAQQRLWFIDQLEGGSAQYNMPMAVRLRGELNHKALQQTLSRIVQRHEVLRTHFIDSDGDACQVIRAAQPFELSVTDLSADSTEQREAQVRTLAAQDAATPFALSGDELLRGQLLQLSDNEHVLLLNMHHIASDGWSMGLLFNELSQLYQAYSQGGDDPFPSLPVQYADYAQWQRQWLQGEVLEQQLGYWREQLAGLPAVHSVPLDYPRPARQRFSGARHGQRLDAELTRQLQALCQDQDVTLFMLLQTAFAALLSRYSNSDDIVMGTPIAGRTHSDTELLIGFFVNTLVLRSRIDGDPTFSELLATNKRTILDAYTHQHIPFEMLVEELSPQRSLSHSPLFQIFFALQNNEQSQLQFGDLELSSAVTSDNVPLKFDLELYIDESGGQLVLQWNYNDHLFQTATIERLADHYARLLRGICATPDQSIQRLPLLSEAERQQVLVGWNNSARDYPREQLAHELFEVSAERYPEQLAVRHGETQLNYHQLNQRANALAAALQQQRINPSQRVVLCLPRGIDLIIGMLGIMKAGAAYVPIDPTLPAARITWLLNDSEPAIVLTHSSVMADLPELACPAWPLDQNGSWRDAGERANIKADGDRAQRVASVIYTSGSTGRPKGVVGLHRGLVNRIHWGERALPLADDEVLCQKTTISFVDHVAEIFQPLAAGRPLVVLDDAQVKDPEALISALNQHRISRLTLVPSLLRVLLDSPRLCQLEHLRYVISSGEALPLTLAQQFARLLPLTQLVNIYGSTEVSADATCYVLPQQATDNTTASDDAALAPIGRPLDNTRIYILNQALQPVPPGVIGEICVAGDCLAQGYWRTTDEQQRFIDNPYADAAGERLFRSGDLGRWLADGNIAYAGRADQQVKIRGFRIEPGEVEHQLLQLDGVEAAAVQVMTVAGEAQLVAYVAGNDELSAADLSAALRERLPSYMLPSIIMCLDALPLNANGKLDRSALPAPDHSDLRQDYVAPRNDIESQLAEIYQQLLQIDQVGIDDSFFDLGGHSLLATRLISQIRRQLGQELPLRMVFEQPAIRGLAALLQCEQAGLALPPIERVDRTGPLPLSYAQQRLWFIDQLEGGSPQYNMPMAYQLSGELNREAFEQAIATIIDRHEVLRSHFVGDGDNTVQVIRERYSLPVRYHDLSSLPPQQRQQQVRELTLADARQPFNLRGDVLLRVQLLRLDERTHVVLTNMHHIAADGWSLGLLFKELNTLYEAYRNGLPSPLPELPVQYADYAHWQRQWLRGEVLEQQLAFWRQQLAGSPPAHSLPLDRPRPPVQGFSGRMYRQQLAPALFARLQDLCQQQDVTLFMLLQTAYAVLITRYSNDDDVVIGTPIAGRSHSDTEDLIGFFVNMLPLRSRCPADQRFSDLLQANKQIIIDAYSHQHIPFEMLVEALQPERNPQHSPLFQISFAVQNTDGGLPEMEGLELGTVDGDHGIIKFDLELFAGELRDGLLLAWNYNTDLFTQGTIERLAAAYEQLLRAVIAQPDCRLDQLDLLTEVDRQQLAHWNDTAAALPAIDLAALFSDQAKLQPQAVAVSDGRDEISYATLEQRANQLAHYLREQGIGLDQRVAVSLPRGIDFIVAVLGIIKAGAAYVPLDRDYPPERLRFMLADSQASLLLTEGPAPLLTGDEGEASVCATLDLADWERLIGHYPQTPPPAAAAGDSLAYLVYTSGSTGQPKGVAATHRAVIRLVREAGYIDIQPSDRIAQASTVSFDAATFEIWGALLNGARLVTLAKEELLDAMLLRRVLRERGISALFVTTALFNQVAQAAPDAFNSLRYVLYGGERCEAHWVRRLLAAGGPEHLLHVYGPTEATTFATWQAVTAVEENATTLPIGQPTGNTQAYILDSSLQRAPLGAVGELYLGGPRLARCYWRRSALSAERFIPDSYSGESGARLYRTGDLARFNEQGQIEYLGRIDHQVKVRGFRIELGEIESRLLELNGVREALAQVQGDQVVAYVVDDQGQDEAAADEAALRQALSVALPAYMVPTAIVRLSQFPLNANGKIDQQALPAPDWSRYQQHYVAPRDQREQQLAQMYCDLLGVDTVGIEDDFFDLGGHSLLATQLISRIREELAVEVPLRSLFEQPTIAGLSAVIAGQGDSVMAPPIDVVDRQQPLPLSYAQQRLWFIDRLANGSKQYNMPLAYRLDGPLDAAALEAALATVIERHEVLRTRYLEQDGEVLQVIDASISTPLQTIDLSGLNEAEQGQRARQLIREQAETLFDLERDPPIRLQLLRLQDDQHLLIGAMHHIASDGWSLGRLFSELSIAYAAQRDGQPAALPPLAIQYADFAHWQRQWLQGEVLEQQLAYWRRQLSELPVVHNLPLDYPRPPEQTYNGAIHQQRCAATPMAAINEFCQRHDVTLFMFLQTAFALLLGRYSNSRDIAVGTPIAGRTQAAVEPLIGFFVNSLVLRSRWDSDEVFLDLLAANKQMIIDAFSHQHIPFEMLVEELQPERTLRYSPLYQVSFSVQSESDTRLSLPGLEVRSVGVEGINAIKFDLQLLVTEQSDGLQFTWTYNTDLFAAQTISRLAANLLQLLEQIIGSPQQAASRLPLIAAAEYQHLLQAAAGTELEYPRDLYFHQWIAAQARQTPAAAAVIQADHTLCYAELNTAANRLAHWLRGQGVAAGARVAVMLQRAPELLVAQLAVLKVGAAYVPVDPKLPAERLAYIVNDAGVALVISQQSLQSALPPDMPALIVDDAAARQQLDSCSDDDPLEETPLDIDRLAYVMYTSGSTGQPKGVPISHRGLLDYCSGALATYYSSELSRSLVVTSHSFDITIPTLYLPLLRGGCVELPLLDAELEHLASALSSAAASAYLVRLTPVHVSALLAQLEPTAVYPGAHVFVIGGAQLTAEVATPLARHFPRARLYNHFGPTETTVGCALNPLTEIPAAGAVPIGRPLPNTHLYVFDEQGQLAPQGVAGELHIGSDGISAGYWNRPELSARHFITSTAPGVAARRLYKTGDMVRWRNDGLLEFIGRSDDQVKIRGYRVELGEIENRLGALAEVELAAVVLRQSTIAQQQLVAYVQPAALTQPVDSLSDAARDALISNYREQLAAVLPDYMLPAVFVLLQQLPLTASGKIDRRALPLPTAEAWSPATTHYVAPVSATEQTLCAIWQDLLGRPQVGVDDNFFDLGGDSIISIQMVAKARQSNLVLTVRDVFRHQTIRALAPHVRNAQASQAEQGLVQGAVPLTPIQHWFAGMDFVQPQHWNMAMLFALPAAVDMGALQSALDQLLAHHDALRLHYPQGDWQAQALADEPTTVPLRTIALSDCAPAALAERMQREADAIQAGIDLSAGCLLNAAVFQLPDGSARLLLVAHHLAIDGVSWRIVQQDLQQTYTQIVAGEDIVLPAKSHSFKDWARHLSDSVTAGLVDAELHYWQTQVDQAQPLYQEGEGHNRVSDMRSCDSHLPLAQTEQLLRQVNQAYRTEINDVLLAALLRAYQQWSGSSSLSLMLEGHGREQLGEGLDVSRTVGWFTSKYPLTLEAAADTDAGALLMTIKEQLRAVPNKGIGYGLLRYLHPDQTVRDSLRPAIPIALGFNYLGQFDAASADHGDGPADFALAPGMTGSSFAAEQQRPDLLSLVASVHDGCLQFRCLYSDQCYQADTIQRLVDGFIRELNHLIEHCVQPQRLGRTPSDYPLCTLSQQQLDQLRADFGDDDGQQLNEIYPLSSVQQGTLYHSQAAAGHYLVQLGLDLQQLNPRAYRRAWEQLVASHSILRTAFWQLDGEQPRQVVMASVELPWQELDWSELSATEQQQRWDELLAGDKQQPFVVEQAPLMRFYLIAVGGGDYRFLWSHHHALIDGWSSPLVMRDLMRAYTAHSMNQPLTLRPAAQFSDYIGWLQQQDQMVARAYWQQALSGLSTPTALSLGRGERSGGAGRIKLERFLAADASARLQQFAQAHRLTLSTLLQGMWGLLLSRYCGEADVLFGMTVSGRPPELAGVSEIVGPFLNTLPVRAQPAAARSVLEYLEDFQQQHLQREQYGYLPLVDIQQCSEIAPGVSLFDSLVVYENYPSASAAGVDGAGDEHRLHISGLQGEESTHYPLTLIVAHHPERLWLRLHYDGERYPAAAMERLLEHYLQLLITASDTAGTILAELPLLSAAELSEQAQWNDTAHPLPQGSVATQFEQQVEQRPEQTAVIIDGDPLSYIELNRQANQLATVLRGQGVGLESRVGVCLGRGPWLLPSLLAIWKAGGAYVPLDPAYPSERLNFMIADAGIELVLTVGAGPDGLDAPIVDLTTLDLSAADTANPLMPVDGASLAYVIYTSGSTGRPKGVMVSHRNILRLLIGTDFMTLDDNVRMLQAAPVAFDASTLELWAPLIHGGVCILYPGDTPTAAQLASVIREQQISHAWLTAALFNTLVDESAVSLRGLKQLAVGGEAVSAAHVKRLYQLDDQVQLINGYGPTESTTFACCHPIPRDLDEHASVAIGGPIGNTQAYVLDSQLQALPIGVVGELYLGGEGLARGYLDRPGLTAERFVPSPFATGERLYRTGDLCRWRADGSVDYVGRLDDQIKLRGFRIELGEVESRLQEQCGVQAAVAQVVDGELGQQLVGYVVVDGDFDESALKAGLQSSLPGYMVPLAIIELNSLPLTANGKLDRSRLPAPDWSAYHREYVAPRDATEEQLAAMFTALLPVEQVGIDDNFFELGGHSLLATRLISRVRQELALELPLRLLFERPTVRELAAALSGVETAALPSLAKAKAESFVDDDPDDDVPADDDFDEEVFDDDDDDWEGETF